MRAEARRAASTNEKAETSRVLRKFSRVVTWVNDPFSCSLSEKPMAWTRKSSLPHFSSIA